MVDAVMDSNLNSKSKRGRGVVIPRGSLGHRSAG